jgi:hypothetical protein
MSSFTTTAFVFQAMPLLTSLVVVFKGARLVDLPAEEHRGAS